MKACVFKGPHNIAVDDIPVPRISDRDVLIRVRLAGICGSDLEVYRGKRNVKTPIVMGHEAVGVVVEVGREVSGISVGDRVVIEPNVYCGRCFYCRKGRMDICENKVVYGINRNGVFSEYVDAPEGFVWRVPKEVPDDAAVLVEPLSVVMRALRRVNVLPSDNVLVIGGGPIGALATIVLQYMGVNVAVTEIAPSRVELLRSIGIKKVVDTTKPDASDILDQFFDGSRADYVIDTVANSESFMQVFRWLRPGGKGVVLGLLGHKAEAEVFPLVRGSITLEGSIIYLGDYIDSLRLVRRGDISSALTKVVTHKFKLEDYVKAFEAAVSSKALKVVLEF